MRRRSPRWEALQHIDIRKKTGAGEGIRTLDPNLGKDSEHKEKQRLSRAKAGKSGTQN
jgi:hypothetical protein